MRLLYTALFYLLLPFILLRLVIRNRRNSEVKARILERLGFYRQKIDSATIWLHAVSYGESVAAEPLIKSLRQHYPSVQILVTTMTATGALRIQTTWKSDEKVTHLFVPYDIPFALKRFLKHFQPKLIVLMETEMWPNLLHYAGVAQIPVLIANARLSAKSLAGYQRIEGFIAPFLQNIKTVAAQSELDAKHFQELGISKQRINITGNLKFDTEIPTTLINQGKSLRTKLPHSHILVAASTHSNEEEQLLEVFARLRQDYPEMLLVLVPRHPYRFDEVAGICQRQGYQIARRSRQELPDINTQVFLGDSMGELYLYYSLADVAFVGGSLIPIGGHNLLEPAGAKVPIVTGPHLFNFTAISGLLTEHGSLFVAHDLEDLYQIFRRLFDDERQREVSGSEGLEVIKKNQGATSNHLAAIQALVPSL